MIRPLLKSGSWLLPFFSIDETLKFKPACPLFSTLCCSLHVLLIIYSPIFSPAAWILIFLFFQPTSFICFSCYLLSHLLCQTLWLCVLHITWIHPAGDKGLSEAWGIPIFLTNSLHLILRGLFCFPRAFALQSIEISCLYLWWASSIHICV